jgi:hypothetical protein
VKLFNILALNRDVSDIKLIRTDTIHYMIIAKRPRSDNKQSILAIILIIKGQGIQCLKDNKLYISMWAVPGDVRQYQVNPWQGWGKPLDPRPIFLSSGANCVSDIEHMIKS